MILRLFGLCLVIALVLPGCSPDASVSVSVGPPTGQIPATEYNKPVSRWVSDSELRVTVVTSETANRRVSRKDPRVLVKGDRLQLCYNLENVLDEPIRPEAWRVQVEFSVSNLPYANYRVELVQGCP